MNDDLNIIIREADSYIQDTLIEDEYSDNNEDDNRVLVTNEILKEMEKINVLKLLDDCGMENDEYLPLNNEDIARDIVLFKQTTKINNDHLAFEQLHLCNFDLKKTINKYKKSLKDNNDSDSEFNIRSYHKGDYDLKEDAGTAVPCNPADSSSSSTDTNSDDDDDSPLHLKRKREDSNSLLIEELDDDDKPLLQQHNLKKGGSKGHSPSNNLEKGGSKGHSPSYSSFIPKEWVFSGMSDRHKKLFDNDHVYPQPMIFSIYISHTLKKSMAEIYEQIALYFEKNLGSKKRKTSNNNDPKIRFKFKSDSNSVPIDFFQNYRQLNWQFILLNSIKTIDVYRFLIQLIVGIPIVMNNKIDKYSMLQFFIEAGKFSKQNSLTNINKSYNQIQTIITNKATIVDSIVPAISVNNDDELNKWFRSHIKNSDCYKWFVKSIMDYNSEKFVSLSPQLGVWYKKSLPEIHAGGIIFSETNVHFLNKLVRNIFNSQSTQIIPILLQNKNILYALKELQSEFCQIEYIIWDTVAHSTIAQIPDGRNSCIWIISIEVLEEYVIKMSQKKYTRQTTNSSTETLNWNDITNHIKHNCPNLTISACICYHIPQEKKMINIALEIEFLLNRYSSFWWITTPKPIDQMYDLQPLWNSIWYKYHFSVSQRLQDKSWKDPMTQFDYKINPLLINDSCKLWLFDFIQFMCIHITQTDNNNNNKQPIECQLTIQNISLNSPELEEAHYNLFEQAVQEYINTGPSIQKTIFNTQIHDDDNIFIKTLRSCSFMAVKLLKHENNNNEQSKIVRRKKKIDVITNYNEQQEIRSHNPLAKVELESIYNTQSNSELHSKFNGRDEVIDTLHQELGHRLKETGCPACLNDFKNNAIQTVCGHLFCIQCMKKWKMQWKNQKNLIYKKYNNSGEEGQLEFSLQLQNSKKFKYNDENNYHDMIPCMICKSYIADKSFKADIKSLLNRYDSWVPYDYQLLHLSMNSEQLEPVTIDKFICLTKEKTIAIMHKHKYIKQWIQGLPSPGPLPGRLVISSAHRIVMEEIGMYLNYLKIPNVYCLNAYESFKHFSDSKETSILLTTHQAIEYPIQTYISNLLLVDPCFYPTTLSQWIKPWSLHPENKEQVLPVTVLITENTIESRLFDIERNYEYHPIKHRINTEGVNMMCDQPSIIRYETTEINPRGSSGPYKLIELNNVFLKSAYQEKVI